MSNRFWDKVEKTDGCWIWTASKDRHGYGQFMVRPGRLRRAHRLAYEAEVGPVPEGLELDHTCRNRACVRPSHLEPVTHRENIMRAPCPAREKTHCKHGHEFIPENTRLRLRNGTEYRDCRACDKERGQRRRDRLAA